MNAQEAIESGVLQLYVCGALNEKDNKEVEEAIENYPEVKEEVENIESSLIKLSQNVAPALPAMVWSHILSSIRKIKKLNTRNESATNWSAIVGWAAAVACIGGIFWMLNQNNKLGDSLEITSTEKEQLLDELTITEADLAETNEVLDILRSKEYHAYTLPGNQAVAPQAYAKVYLNKETNVAYIDAQGLPEAPEGKVYQVWSLKMQPLTPTSVGLLASSDKANKRIFKFEGFPEPEAFGITLEPEGGSESPSLDQLYTLGTIPTATP
ncbi:anti-sigma factor [Patiriisocius hiemis]|uniref:Anti-sigma factor n=1 Tax=Patiriisocius hiemis TaxID=3075604 RepID=A0ABU2YA85_9FLAO|nr:anti-sigma factor [Constantimarinum sp. W242]MDT0555098.1 anti-sigma factor [Constantimarinum sp. W242]